MIPAIVTGGSTAGLMNYLVGPGRANEHESPHLVAGSEVIMRRWAAWEELTPAQGYEIAGFVDQYMSELGVKPVGAVRRFNHEAGVVETVKDVACHVWHCSLSLSPEEGPLSEERWRAIAGDFMDEMGFTGADGKAPCRWVAVHHGQSKAGGDHVHIVANIVREDGTRWSAWQDQRRAQRAANVLEHRYGLQVIESREHQRGARADSHRDLRATQRRREATTDRARLENRVRAAAVGARSEAEFVQRLRDYGVRARPRFAEGRTDVVVGYSVAMHSYDPSARTQWYGGGRLARDLALPRLRARWEDTTESAQRAVRAWQHAWSGSSTRAPARHPRTPDSPWLRHAHSTRDWHARADALRTYHDRLRGLDASDPVALADATRDVAGLLAAQALTRTDEHERELLERAARAVGRHAQTHTRPASFSPVPDAVVLAAQLASVALVSDPATARMLLTMELMQLVRTLADLYDQQRQTNTAQALLAGTTAAFASLHAVDVPELGEQQPLMATATAAHANRAGTMDVARTGSQPVATDITQEQADRVRRIFDAACPPPAGRKPGTSTAGATPAQRPSSPQQSRRSGHGL